MFNEYDIIIPSKTWLDSQIFNSELHLNKNTVYRIDRPIYTLVLRSLVVEVIIAVKNTLSSSIMPDFDNFFEQFIVKIQHLVLAVAYIPPLGSFDNGINFEDCLIVGDFNIPGCCSVRNNIFSNTTGHHRNHNIRLDFSLN